MKSIWKFKRNYLVAACVLFIIEIVIALFVHDNFVRPYVGDFLVVILIYCFLKSLINIPVQKAAIYVLLFSYSVEISQHLNIVNKLGLQNSRLARTIMGTSFEWVDFIAYTLGIIAVLYAEKIMARQPAIDP